MRVRLQPLADGWAVAALHLPLAILSGIALAVGRWLPVDLWPLVPCWFHEVTGRPCPFCGASRAFSLTARGNWWEGAQMSPLGTFTYALCVATFVVSIVALATKRRLSVELGPVARRTLWIGLGLLVLASWAYRWTIE